MKRIMTGIIMVLALALAPTLIPSGTAYAACSPSGNASKDQIIGGIGETGGDCTGSGVNHIIKAVVEILSLIVGIAGIIMVILGGFKYITSGGDAGKIANAKNTLLYALVGLAVAAVAQFLVHFVLSNADQATHPSTSSSRRGR